MIRTILVEILSCFLLPRGKVDIIGSLFFPLELNPPNNFFERCTFFPSDFKLFRDSDFLGKRGRFLNGDEQSL